MEAAWIIILVACFCNRGLAETYDSGVAELNVNGSSISLTVKSPTGKTWEGNLGLTLPPDTTSSKCDLTNDINQDDVCLQFSNGWTLTVNRHSKIENCSVLTWTSSNSSDTLQDCFALGNGHWYGGGEQFTQHWNVEQNDELETPCVTYTNNNPNFGGVMERYWVSTDGYAIQGSFNSPLFYSLSTSEKNFCFKSKNKRPYYLTDPNYRVGLSYAVCSGIDVKDTHTRWIKGNQIKPASYPDERTIVSPIWSTWAIYKANINVSMVVDFANQILANNFTHSQLEIDDNWETCYGEQVFNQHFPDPKAFIKSLNDLGFRTTIWVHPFVNSNCPQYKTLADKGYFVMDALTGKAGLAPWWDGFLASIVDMVNDDAVEWYKNRLQGVLNLTGINSFKFDAGETSWLPVNYKLSNSKYNETSFPSIWTQKYVDMASTFGNMIEVRVGSQNYKNGVFIRMLDKDSKWGRDNGLQSLIPTNLVFGLLGYPYVLPDMVGGNAYGTFPDKQLFIRWMEANVFLPAIQFSIPPWVYDNETIAISKKMMDIRESHGDVIISVFKESLQNGYPVIRPLWWLAPNDPDAQIIIDEYLLGDDLLVAPIVVENATQRDIYIPPGSWKDQLRGGDYTGPSWVRNYTVQIDELAYFKRNQ